MIRYMPLDGFSGHDALSYRVCDSLCRCAVGNVMISVDDRRPSAAHDVATTDQNAVVTIDVLANDQDPDDALNPASVVVVEGPSRGQATPDQQIGAIRYAPTPGVIGDANLQQRSRPGR